MQRSDGETTGDAGPDGATTGDAGPDGETTGDAGPDGATTGDAGPDGATTGDAGPDSETTGDAGPDGETTSDTAHQDSEETLAEAFWSVMRVLRLATHAAVAPLGLTPGQARAVTSLARHGRMRLSELSERLHIAPRSTTEVVDALEAEGFAAREPDETDRRATLVVLTERGAQVGRQLAQARAAEADAFFGRLGTEDRAELRRILDTLRDDDVRQRSGYHREP